MFKKVVVLIKNERGTVDQLVWVLGSTLVVAVVIGLLVTVAQNQLPGFFTTAVSWIQNSFGKILGT